MIVLGYAVTAMVLVAIFLGELLRSRATFALLATGVVLLIVSLVVDFFATEGTVVAVIEDPANVLGAACVVSAYLVKLREVTSELPATPQPIVAGGLPSTP